MKDVIILQKNKRKEKLLENIVDTTTPAEIAQVLNLIYLN